MAWVVDTGTPRQCLHEGYNTEGCHQCRRRYKHRASFRLEPVHPAMHTILAPPCHTENIVNTSQTTPLTLPL
jgi:hypothetical protein